MPPLATWINPSSERFNFVRDIFLFILNGVSYNSIMSDRWIKNFDQLAIDENRKKALEIIEAGLDVIKTERVINNSVKVEDNNLIVLDKNFNLDKFKRIRIIGFGKVSCDAAIALEKIIGAKLDDGIVISNKKAVCEVVKVLEGTHPMPSQANVQASADIVKMAKDAQEDDLFIIIISGGGSALLCWPEDECTQGQKLYEEFLITGGNIEELNILRKHISLLKGGGLAKLLYPATIVGLVFCDIPGDNISIVASGPTFKDESTVDDAKTVIEKYGLSNDFDLTETPKDNRYFENVFNIKIVSNGDALSAMAKKAESFGLKNKVISTRVYDLADRVTENFFNNLENNSAVLGGGEISLLVKNNRGSGGRNQYLAASFLNKIKDNQVFISIDSDGLDNSSVAGALVDLKVKKELEDKHINVDDYIERFDAHNMFKGIGNLIDTGPTGANVSDLMMLIDFNE